MTNFRRLLPPLLLIATLLLAAQVALSQPPPGDVVLVARHPSSWREVRTPWLFLWKVPYMESWQFAENKMADPFVKSYKVDVHHPACATWSWVDDTPAVEFVFDYEACDGFILESGFYYFDLSAEPAPTVTPTPSHTLTDWIPRFVTYYAETGLGYNDAGDYGVEVYTPASSEWVIHVHHLTGAENNGNHHVFFSVVDESGGTLPAEIRYCPATCSGDWRTLRVNGLADVPMEKNDTLAVTLGDAAVDGLHARHPDEEAGNTWGHHSFYVVFQRAGGPAPGPTPTVTATPGPGPTPVLCPNARSITIYGGGGGLTTSKCGCNRYGEAGTDGVWWALICQVPRERFDEFLDAWQELVLDARNP